MGQYTSYYLYQKYEKRGEQDWIPCYPNTYSISGDATNPMSLVVKSENDTQCGYTPTPTEPIIEWVNLDPSTDYYCNECPTTASTYVLTWEGGARIYNVVRDNSSYNGTVSIVSTKDGRNISCSLGEHSCDWVTVTLNGNTLEYSISANISGEDRRSSNIEIIQNESGKKIYFSVNQDA